ncbi:MAG: hypothetical protein JWL76_2393, partial [Thermoleophilia bacterium]|nr:hypothetical protein [Thermoleophilia bacterium]
MATNVQGSASSIGMAPAGAGAGAGAGGILPGLTGGAGDPGAGAGAVDPTAGVGTAGAAAPGAAQDPAAAAGGALPGGFDINKLASTGRWLGPLMTIGGGVAALMAFKNPAGSNFLKFGGITAALSGVGLTAIGFKAKGIETGTKATEAQAVAAMQQLQSQYEATMTNLQQQAT